MRRGISEDARLGVKAARRIVADTPLVLAELLDIAEEVEPEDPMLAARLREAVRLTTWHLFGVEAAIDDVLGVGPPGLG